MIVILSIVLAVGVAAISAFIGLVIGHLSAWPKRAQLEASKAALETERTGLLAQVRLLNDALQLAADQRVMLGDLCQKTSEATTSLLSRLHVEHYQQVTQAQGTEKVCPVCGVTCESSVWPNNCPKCGTLYGAEEPAQAEQPTDLTDFFKLNNTIDG